MGVISTLAADHKPVGGAHNIALEPQCQTQTKPFIFFEWPEEFDEGSVVFLQGINLAKAFTLTLTVKTGGEAIAYAKLHEIPALALNSFRAIFEYRL